MVCAKVSGWEIYNTGEIYFRVTCRKRWVFKCLERNFHEGPRENSCNLDIWVPCKTVALHARSIAFRKWGSCSFEGITYFVNEHLVMLCSLANTSLQWFTVTFSPCLCVIHFSYSYSKAPGKNIAAKRGMWLTWGFLIFPLFLCNFWVQDLVICSH